MPDRVARRAVTDLENTVIARMQKLTSELFVGTRSLPAWQKAMQAEIQKAQLVANGLALGGRANLTANDLFNIQRDVAYQYGRLQRWAAQIDAGRGKPDLGRAASYARASTNSAYQNARKGLMLASGGQLVVWVRTARESCDGCIEQSQFDPRPIEEVPDIGTQDCMANCRCYLEYVEAT